MQHKVSKLILAVTLAGMLSGCGSKPGHGDLQAHHQEHTSIRGPSFAAADPQSLPLGKSPLPATAAANARTRSAASQAAKKPKKVQANPNPSAISWLPDYAQARQQAQHTGKPIFAVFR
ncbi:hypothetical protein HRbin36_00387 [bacterium HR36]|nr:hypothetical protein HRbin36_00387 [bacterium HR36]